MVLVASGVVSLVAGGFLVSRFGGMTARGAFPFSVTVQPAGRRRVTSVSYAVAADDQAAAPIVEHLAAHADAFTSVPHAGAVPFTVKVPFTLETAPFTRDRWSQHETLILLVRFEGGGEALETVTIPGRGGPRDITVRLGPTRFAEPVGPRTTRPTG